MGKLCDDGISSVRSPTSCSVSAVFKRVAAKLKTLKQHRLIDGHANDNTITLLEDVAKLLRELKKQNAQANASERSGDSVVLPECGAMCEAALPSIANERSHGSDEV